MKPLTLAIGVVLGGVVLTGVGLHAADDAASGAPSTIAVTNTFDGRPFTYTERLLRQGSGAEVFRWHYPSPLSSDLPQNNTVPADYYRPANLRPGEAGRPAVICLPILNGDEDLTAMMCSVLAARGIPAVTFKLPYYGERGPAEGRGVLATDPQKFLAALQQAGLEIRRTVDLLAARPEINPRLIGIAGISLGGIMSAAAAGMEPRLNRAALLLAGGDLTTIIHHARETRALSSTIQRLPADQRQAVETRLAAFDPLTHAPALRERARQGRVLMLNAGQDEVIPRACTEKLAEALGLSRQVVWFEGLGHYTALAELPRALQMMADFFAQDLPPAVVTNASSGPVELTNATQRLVGVLGQLVTMAAIPPATGRCHYLEGSLAGRDPAGRNLQGEGRLVLGAEGKFCVRVQSPAVGEWGAGQGEFPWLLMNRGGQSLLVVGTRQPVAGNQMWHYVDPQHLLKLQLLAGAAASLMLAPDLAQRWVNAEFDAAGLLRVSPREPQYRDHLLRLQFQPRQNAPEQIYFLGGGYDVVFKVRGWQTNTLASAALFEPPANLPRREVPQQELQRDLAGVLNFLADQVRVGPASSAAPGATNALRVRPEVLLKTYLVP